jgi:hypothetical protein
MILFEQRRRIVGLVQLVVEESVLETKRPIEPKVTGIAMRKVLGLENLRMSLKESIPQGRPREEVNSNWMLGVSL